MASSCNACRKRDGRQETHRKQACRLTHREDGEGILGEVRIGWKPRGDKREAAGRRRRKRRVR